MTKFFTKHFFVLFLFGLSGILVCRKAQAATATDRTEEPVRIFQEWFQVPVLKYKEDNPVLRIQVSLNMEASVTLSKVLIGTGGTSNLRDIQAIRIYYDQRKTSSSRLDTDDGQITLFGDISRAGKKNSIPGELRLSKGTHTFWVSFELSASADITHMLGVSCLGMVLDDHRYLPAAVPATSAVPAASAAPAVNAASASNAGIPVSAVPQLLRMGAAVRLHGQDNIHTSRIPGLATTNKGTLLAIFDARRDTGRDLQGNIDIGLHRSTDGGNSWEPIRIAMDMGEWGGLPEKYNGVSDACILLDQNTDAIYIAGLWMHGVLDTEGNWVEGLNEQSEEWNHQWRNKASQPGFDVKQTAQFMIVKSTDDGKTWGDPVNLTRMIKRPSWWLLAPAPGRGITLEDGTLVFPTQGRNEKGKGFSNITYSTDGGKTWQTSNPATGAVRVSTSECAVAQLEDGSLMLNMRAGVNKGNMGDDNGRGVAVTSDMGQTWRTHSTSFNALPEPTCMASLYSHHYEKEGKKQVVLLFSNPNSKKFRENMTIKASFDDGHTWPEQHQLLLDQGRGRGYSCLTSVGEDYIGILYESSQADLVFQKVSLSTLLKGSQTKNVQTR